MIFASSLCSIILTRHVIIIQINNLRLGVQEKSIYP